jgi:hypothetical protein
MKIVLARLQLKYIRHVVATADGTLFFAVLTS